jgi:hypothetical protein
MNSDIRERVRTIQAQMAESAKSCFSEQERNHLGALIRVTVEFHDHLQSFDSDPVKLEYMCESVFAGFDSFMLVTHAYSVVSGTSHSTIDLESISLPSLKEQFGSVFSEFVREAIFEKKCRLLLDLLKLQIVFAGISYN